MAQSPLLDVFLSSAQHEFERARKELARRISRIPFLTCSLLEESGAASEDTTSASLRGVREADIFVLILGRRYSPIVAAEYHEAVKRLKPPLIYLKDSRVRDQELREFLDQEVKPSFKYHEFNSSRELYRRIDSDLRQLLTRLLRTGLERTLATKEKLAELERQAAPQPGHARGSDAAQLLSKARVALSKAALLESIILTRSALEAGLSEALQDAVGNSSAIRGRAFNELVRLAEAGKLLAASDSGNLARISRMRNAAAHEGLVPDTSEVQWALDIAETLFRTWRIVGQ